MKITECREKARPRRIEALTELSIILTRKEVDYIKTFAKIVENSGFTVRGSSTVVDLIKAIKEVDLGG